jgi:hypothetical protein
MAIFTNFVLSASVPLPEDALSSEWKVAESASFTKHAMDAADTPPRKFLLDTIVIPIVFTP